MSDTIRIKRHRVVEYDIQEYIDLTPEEYAQVVEIIGADANDWNKSDFEDIDNAVWNVVGDEWEADWSEPGNDRTTEIWIEENK